MYRIPLLQALHDNLGLIAGILGSATTVWAVKPLRRGFLAACRIVRGYVTGPLLLAEIAEKVRKIEHEVKLNGGGSMKDSLARLEAGGHRAESYRRHDFWTRGRPAMEIDGDGQVMLVSEALVQLCHLSTPEDLYRRSWQRFLAGDETSDFLEAFVATAANDSQFAYPVRLRDLRGEDRGEWLFSAAPMDTSGAKIYVGLWLPVDGVAREIAARHRWAG